MYTGKFGIWLIAGLLLISPLTSLGQGKKFYGKDFFLIEGTAFEEDQKESPYDRLPAAFKDRVRPPVWELSKSSAGISVRFFTNSTSISVKWELLFNTRMNHMAETGIKGLDLYCRTVEGWQYVNTARPVNKVNEASLVSNMPVQMREYRIYLPLYDGVTSLEVGIDSSAVIRKAEKTGKKPVVFYGTSITQGGCASRTGMAYTSIISRKAGIECINLGFSGNGRMEQPVAEAASLIDAAFFVIDCVPNMSAEEIFKNTRSLVEVIRSKQPEVPLVFVETMYAEKSFFDEAQLQNLRDKNAALRSEYRKMVKKGIRNIFYIENDGLIGNDHEATVDGVHFTDLGFMRFADNLIREFKKFRLL